jgi:hypothetical protein
MVDIELTFFFFFFLLLLLKRAFRLLVSDDGRLDFDDDKYASAHTSGSLYVLPSVRLAAADALTAATPGVAAKAWKRP